MKVAIIGAGIGGLSLARELHMRGVQVALFDQGPIPNPVASSVDEHRITRHTYGGLPGYAALMPAAFAAYDSLWRDIGRVHYLPTGIVYMTRGGVDRYPETAAELDHLGIPHTALDLAELAASLPQVSIRGVTSAFRAEGSGILFAARITRDLAAWLGAQAGVTLHPGAHVSAVDPERGRLVAGGVTHDADVVVVAAGAWVRDLLPGLSGRLVPSRQMVLYLDPPARFAPAWASSPVLVDVGPEHGAYILPPREGTRLKIGDHRFTRIGDGKDDRIATDFDQAPVVAAAATALTDFADYRQTERKVCYYTVTEDERFVIEPVGAAGWVQSACSGHGFKLGALMGRILARAITGELTAAQATALAAGQGDPDLLAL